MDRDSCSRPRTIEAMTRLESPLKRELEVRGKPYVVTLSPDGLRLVPKGRRKGLELRWEDLLSGEAALATALNASLAASKNPVEPKQR